MEDIQVIPARYASTRFEGKPLKLIDGKPMIKIVITRELRMLILINLLLQLTTREYMIQLFLLEESCNDLHQKIINGTGRIIEVINNLRIQ